MSVCLCCELFPVLLAEEYAYLLNKSESFIAHQPITAVLLSVVFSCTSQFMSRWLGAYKISFKA